MSFHRVFPPAFAARVRLTSNIMDFRLSPSLPTSLLLFIRLIESVLSYSGWSSLPVIIVVNVSSILGGCNEFSQNSFKEETTHRHRGLWWTCCTHQPWRNAWQFSVVTLYCKSVSFPWLSMLHLLHLKTGEQMGQWGNSMCWFQWPLK